MLQFIKKVRLTPEIIVELTYDTVLGAYLLFKKVPKDTVQLSFATKEEANNQIKEWEEKYDDFE